MRLDVSVAKRLELSRAVARNACQLKKVLLNSRPAKAGAILKQGDVVEITELPKPVEPRPELAGGDALVHISINFEDKYLLAIEKPRAMHSVRQRAEDPLTVADCLASYCPATVGASSNRCESGLVQRLDFYTCGLMLAAKSTEAWNALRLMLKKNQINKSYLALVEGLVEKNELIINNPIEKHEACSRVALIKTFARQSLVRVSGQSMRRHQVRIHLSQAGHPLVGDSQYGASSESFTHPDSPSLSGEGFYLLAERIEFKHPCTGKRLLLEVRRRPNSR